MHVVKASFVKARVVNPVVRVVMPVVRVVKTVTPLVPQTGHPSFLMDLVKDFPQSPYFLLHVCMV
jgi:hypothetical protein